MSDRLLCPPEEDIVRALRTADYDPQNDRRSRSMFKNPYTSVSRLKILGLDELFPIFHNELDRDGDPPNVVIAVGEINIGTMQTIGREHTDKPTEITVEEAPTTTNKAHAEVVQGLSVGLSNKIVQALTIRLESNSTS